MTELRIGFIALTDAAALIAAAELGFAADEGLRIRLEREASWATLRDKLALGFVDAAHMLAPLAIATSLGLAPRGAPLTLVAPLALNLNGNAFTVSLPLWGEMTDAGPTATYPERRAALAAAIRGRGAAGRPPLTLATVHPFSTHTYQLRRLLGPEVAETDVRITVVPPAHMVEALRMESVDGFCVGSPWNSVAVESGFGRIAALGTEIAPGAPEKVLAWPRGRLDPAIGAAVVRAVQAAGDWCAEPANRGELAFLLAKPQHLDLPAAIIRRTLDGRLIVDPDGSTAIDPDYLTLGGATHRPAPEQARWIFAEMVAADQVGRGRVEEAAAVYDPAFYEDALRMVAPAE
ncbi:ABC transporter substrate-binding protein [uncultured Enterovirga sp.]|uniref:ABC transporter substrate-binding protein n=1 Tax=uncultured Enterovirga sp. TaxID=2026352 RepID=UPI0035C9D1E0